MDNMAMTSEQILLSSVNMANLAINLPEAFKLDILQKYETLAQAKISSNSNIITENLFNYQVLLNKTLFLTLVQTRKPVDLVTYTNLNNMLQLAIKDTGGTRNINAFDRLYKELSKDIVANGGVISLTPTADDVQDAIKTFGIEHSVDDIDPDDIDGLEGDIIDETDLDGMNLDGLFDEGEEDEVPADDNIVIDDDIDLNGEEATEEEDDTDRDYLEAFRQIYEGADASSMTPLRIAIDGIIKSLSELYASCFSGITAPDGILTNKGLLSLDRVGGKYKFLYNHADYIPKPDEKADYKNAEYVKYSQNKGRYGQYYKAIMYAIGVTLGNAERISGNMTPADRNAVIDSAVQIAEGIFGSNIDGRKSILPKLEDARNAIHYYPRLHTQFMTGNFTVSADMHKWAEENKVHRNAVKITNFDDLTLWYRKQVSECLTQALIDAGLKIEDAGLNDGEVTSICQLMSKNIKNIIVITNEKTKKNGYLTVKICTGEAINIKSLTSNISEYFSSASAGSKSTEIIVKNDGAASGVIELDIVLSREDYDKASAFSADIIDDIIETGNVPSWGNAILGELNNGGALAYNFKKNYSISVYGSSGSGKGIMTSALLSNAIAEGCEVMYFDGKPDNGAALGKVAWDAGVDCAVFNANSGKAVGGCAKTFPDFLESYTHGIRNLEMRNSVIAKIPCLDDNPDWPFKSRETLSRTMLYEVSLALNAFKFVHDAIISRSQGNIEKNPDGSDRWAVFVIDEIENAAGNENTIRGKMKTYMDKIGEKEVYREESKTDKSGNVTVQQKKDGKIKDAKNWDKDPGYLFCKQWLDWADNVCANWDSVVTISLRNSSSTLITIFQTNKWFNQSGSVSTGKTKIGQLMLRLSPKTIKIVGKGALVADNQWGDHTEYAWSSEVNKGKWVVASNEGTLSDSDKIFKPFKVFTTDLGADVPVPPEDYGAGANDCYSCRDDIGKVTTTGKLKKPLGLQSYIRYLFNSLSSEINQQLADGKRMPGTETPEGVLSTSLSYFDSLIRVGGTANGRGLVDRMYDVKPISNFSGQISEAEATEIQSREEQNEANDLDALNSGLNVVADNAEERNFGTQGNGSQEPFTGNTGTQVNTSNMTDEDAFAGFGGGATSHQPNNAVATIPNFTKATILMSKNYSDEALMGYFNKFRLSQKLMHNSYNYSDRTPKTNVNGLALATIIIGNYVYITEKLCLGQQQVIANAYNNINAGRNRDYSYSFLLGIIDSLKDGSLQYDKMPTPEQMREWASRYIAVQQGNTGQAPVQQQVPNPIDVTGVHTEPSTPTEDIGARVLRLSQQICLERNWTAQQLIEFQNQVLSQMGVQ